MTRRKLALLVGIQTDVERISISTHCVGIWLVQYKQNGFLKNIPEFLGVSKE